MMNKNTALTVYGLTLAFVLGASVANAQTYRSHVQPLIKAQCAECHGADAPTLAEFKLDEEKYKKRQIRPSHRHL